MSILFVDLVGFTARSEHADPEDIRDSLQLYHREAKRRIEEYGGVVEKFIGDAVMAVFGAPVAHGDDAERAVRAGLRVLEGIEELNDAHQLELAARGAVNTGEAIVSVEHGRAGDPLATGDVVNTASRLQSAAPTGRLLVGEITHRATRHVIRYETIDSVAAKGKTNPVAAWLTVAPSLAPAERPVGDSSLVGRAHELVVMLSLWARCVSERRPHLITVLGPPGIGKTRLCRETASALEPAPQILSGRCLPYEARTGYQAFSRIVHQASGILESDASAVALSKLHAAVEAVVPAEERVDVERYLALLLGLAPDDEVPQVLLLYFAARRFIECIALAQPTLLVFEDVHWAQRSEIALLEYLARHLRDARVLLVATARPEFLEVHTSWGAGMIAHTTLPLYPLTAEDAKTLASELVQDGATTPDLSRLIEVAGGNPLFIEALVASAAERGDGGELPVTVREAIAARIDAMPTDARNALLSAAVFGNRFWRAALQAVEGVAVDAALDALEAHDLVRRDLSSQLDADTQFTFKHILVRDVAYATLPREERRRRHAAIARHLEETAAMPETLSANLAYHWGEAGESARAIPYLLAAADAARRGWAKDAVVDLYAKAAELAEDEASRNKLLLGRGMALVELADYEAAAAELEALVPQLDGEDKLEALIALGHATLWTERMEETAAVATEAAALAELLGDASVTPAVHAMQSQGYAMRGEEGDLDRALELGDRALDLWVPGTRPLDLRHHLHLHADTTYWVGDYERSVALSQRTRALAADVHSAESLLRGGGLEALALAGLGRHEEAIAIWEELLELAQELGQNPRGLLNYSTLAYRELHDLREAERRSEEALELSASETFGMPRQFAGSDLLFTRILAGDIGGAQSKWPALWAGAHEATGWTTWLITGRLACARAEIALHAESADAAADWAQQAIAIAVRTRRRKYHARSLTLLGRALARLGSREQALDALRSAAAIADQLVGAPGRWQARAALGEVAYSVGDDDAARVAYEAAGELIETFAGDLSREHAERLRAAPDVARVLSLSRPTPLR